MVVGQIQSDADHKGCDPPRRFTTSPYFKHSEILFIKNSDIFGFLYFELSRVYRSISISLADIHGIMLPGSLDSLG